MEKNSERTHNVNCYSEAKINERFCKDEYVYLLKGTECEHIDGLRSRSFKENITLKDILKDIKDIKDVKDKIKQLEYYQSSGISTPFI